MNPPTHPSGRATPWHLWLVGVPALLWNSVGAFDFVMTETRNASYMGGVGGLAFSAVIFVVAPALGLHARRLSRAGVLR